VVTSGNGDSTRNRSKASLEVWILVVCLFRVATADVHVGRGFVLRFTDGEEEVCVVVVDIDGIDGL